MIIQPVDLVEVTCKLYLDKYTLIGGGIRKTERGRVSVWFFFG